MLKKENPSGFYVDPFSLYSSFSTHLVRPIKAENPDNQGLFVPRPAFEILNINR